MAVPPFHYNLLQKILSLFTLHLFLFCLINQQLSVISSKISNENMIVYPSFTQNMTIIPFYLKVSVALQHHQKMFVFSASGCVS